MIPPALGLGIALGLVVRGAGLPPVSLLIISRLIGVEEVAYGYFFCLASGSRTAHFIERDPWPQAVPIALACILGTLGPILPKPPALLWLWVVWGAILLWDSPNLLLIPAVALSRLLFEGATEPMLGLGCLCACIGSLIKKDRCKDLKVHRLIVGGLSCLGYAGLSPAWVGPTRGLASVELFVEVYSVIVGSGKGLAAEYVSGPAVAAIAAAALGLLVPASKPRHWQPIIGVVANAVLASLILGWRVVPATLLVIAAEIAGNRFALFL